MIMISAENSSILLVSNLLFASSVTLTFNPIFRRPGTDDRERKNLHF